MHQQTRTQAAPAPLATKAAPSGVLQRKCACGTHTVAGGECDSCRKRHDGALQRAAAGAGTARAVPPVVREVLDSPGRPLEAGARSFMETRFGHDFSRVRVHTDSRADESARSVNALAYTVGEDIVFASGRYSPGTDAGRRLLAHEMTHVLQQRQSAGVGVQGLEIDGGPGDRYEMEADAVAAQVMSGAGANPPRVSAYRVAAAPQRLMRQSGGPPATVCPAPTGKPQQPATASPKLLARILGKTKGDPGEGCREEPYPAGSHEKVCTIGYGRQINDPPCTLLFKETGQVPTQEQRDTFAKDLSKFSCACAGQVKEDCKTGGAKTKAGKQVDGAASHVHDVVPVDLDQAQFDALVDVTLHHGSLPPDFVETIKKYWCTREGRNYVRELYLVLEIKPEEYRDAFMKRRKERVWPHEGEQFGPPPPPVEKPPAGKPAPKPKPPELKPVSPNQPPVAQAAAGVNNFKVWTDSLVRRGTKLVDRILSDNSPTSKERKAFWDESAQWFWVARESQKRYRAAGREEAANEVGELLDREGPRIEDMRTRLGNGD